MVTVVGCVKEAFDFGVLPLPSQPVSAEGMHVTAHYVYSCKYMKHTILGIESCINI